MRAAFVVVLAALAPACAPRASEPSTSAPTRAPAPGVPSGALTPAAPPLALTAAERVRIDRLVSVFENGTPEIQYAYVEDLADGRGFTVGRGFTTATGDALAVVLDYASRAPGAPLVRYVPELRRLAAARSFATRALAAAGFPAAWRAACADPRFLAAQDAEVERSSLVPAIAHARRLGVTSPLGIAVLYDTVVQHGDGDDPDGVPALVREATAGGAPRDGVGEARWLQRFLEIRRAHLGRAHDPATRAAWAASVPRVDALAELVQAGNLGLRGPLVVRHGFDAIVP